MTEHDSVLSRLRGLASVPVDDAVAERHLEQLAAVDAAPGSMGHRSRVVLMGAVVAGTMLSGATLAGAATGKLPAPAQDAAHTAFAKVGIEVPKAKAEAKGKGKDKASKAEDTGGPGRVERFHGDATTPCTLPDGSPFVGNHGEYVKAHPDDPATVDVNEREVAAQSPCGKPVQSMGEDTDAVDGDNGKKPEGTGRPESPGKSEGHKPADTGRPEDAGKHDDAGKPEDGTSETVDVDEVETGDSVDNSGAGGNSGKGRGGTGKAPVDDTDAED